MYTIHNSPLSEKSGNYLLILVFINCLPLFNHLYTKKTAALLISTNPSIDRIDSTNSELFVFSKFYDPEAMSSTQPSRPSSRASSRQGSVWDKCLELSPRAGLTISHALAYESSGYNNFSTVTFEISVSSYYMLKESCPRLWMLARHRRPQTLTK